MTDQPHDNTELGLDADMSAAVATAADIEALGGERTDSLDHLKQMYASAEARTRIGLGREVQRLTARLTELDREAEVFLFEVEQLRRPLRGRLAASEAMLEHIALHRRREGDGNFFEVPGVGRWSTRSAGGRFKLDNAKVIAWLRDHDADLYADFTDLPDPVPPERRLDGTSLRQHLSTQVPAARNEDETKIANAVGEALAASMDGVEWVPPVIGVDYSLIEREERNERGER